MPSPSHPYSHRPVPYSKSPMPSFRPIPSSQSPSASPSHTLYAFPSKSLTPSNRPHITPIRKADMIPPTPLQENSMVSSLEIAGVFGICILFAIILRFIRLESAKAKAKGKVKIEGFSPHGYTQQINPTAYNTLHLIRRSSSNNLASGSVSPV